MIEKIKNSNDYYEKLEKTVLKNKIQKKRFIGYKEMFAKLTATKFMIYKKKEHIFKQKTPKVKF